MHSNLDPNKRLSSQSLDSSFQFHNPSSTTSWNLSVNISGQLSGKFPTTFWILLSAFLCNISLSLSLSLFFWPCTVQRVES